MKRIDESKTVSGAVAFAAAVAVFIVLISVPSLILVVIKSVDLL